MELLSPHITVIHLMSIQEIFEYQVNIMINLSPPDEPEQGSLVVVVLVSVITD